MKKDTAGQIIGAQMVSATDGSAFTGAVTCYVCGDGGTQAAGSVGSGACTHEGNGYHTYAPAQAETNYDLVAFTFTGTGAVPATVQVFTGYPQTGDSYARLGAAGAGLTAIGDARLANLDATVSSRSTLDAAGVWSHATRTLSSFGTLVADIWANVTRTLTAQADSAGVTTLLSRVVGTLAAGTHQPQTGDAYARLGAPAGASVSADIADVEGKVDDLESRLGTPADLGSGATVAANLADIEAQTDDIGAAGAGLTAVPWNAAWDAEVQSEATDALNAYDPPTKAELDSAVAALATSAALATVDGIVDAILEDTGTTLPAAIAAISAGAGLTAQQVRDAMKLAPSAGAAADGSIDDLLADMPAAIGAQLADSEITVNLRPVVSTDGQITLYQGYDYNSADNRAVEFTVASPDFTGATTALKFDSDSYAGSVVNPGLTTQLLRFEFTAAQTEAMTAGYHVYRLEVTRAGRLLLEEIGMVHVKE